MSIHAGRTTDLGRRLGGLGAGVALVGLSTLVAHQATYVTTAGSAEAYAAAMSSSGHDGTWLPLVTAVLVAATLLTVVAAWRLLRLSAIASRHSSRPAASHSLDDAPSLDAYARLVGTEWARTAAATLVAYAVLENVERVLAGLTPPGLDALVVHGPVPVLLILASSLLVAAVSALVRSRVRTLMARIRADVSVSRRRPAVRRQVASSRRPAHRWSAASASRAPPRVAPAA